MFPNMGILHDYMVDKEGVTIITKLRVPNEAISLSLKRFSKDIVFVTVKGQLLITGNVFIDWRHDMIKEISEHGQLEVKRLKIIARKLKIALLRQEILAIDKEACEIRAAIMSR